MPEITRSACTTLINVFTVDPANAPKLADVLTAATDKVMQYLPGFISASIHLSSDGTRVVNYAQWESAEAYGTMLENPTAREHMEEAAVIYYRL